jgi:LysR family transcriptional regulator for bpeEF and oprC
MLYPHQRFLSHAVRAFADWISGLFNEGAGEKGLSGKRTALQYDN